MKKIISVAFLIFMLIGTGTIEAQRRKKTDILKSTDIKEIENFLKKAHPEDPRRTVLKPKLIALKNSEWTKGAKNHKPMEARPIVTDIPSSFTNRPNSDEAEEFKRLMTVTSDAHKEKTVKLLNTLFDQDIHRKEAILLVQNSSDCNMILRIQGTKNFYNLAVPAKGENTMVLDKGAYDLNSNICDAKYASRKDIAGNLMIILNNPVYRTAKEMRQNK